MWGGRRRRIGVVAQGPGQSEGKAIAAIADA
jgi:hypothetical protein